MQKDTAKKTFDIAERDRMRSALLRYMQEHRIGVPSLQIRIAQAANRSADLVPLKTLQRFLAHSHRTNDSFLIPVYQFSADLPARDDDVAVAQMLAKFFGGATAQPAVRDTRSGLSGSFVVFVEKDAPKILGRKDKPFRARKSNLSARSDEQRGVAVLVEEVLLKDDGSPLHMDSEFRHRYEGFALDIHAPIIALLRNVLTGFPKSYWLYPDGDQKFQGYVSVRGFNEPDQAEPGLHRPRTVIVEVASQEDEQGREGQSE